MRSKAMANAAIMVLSSFHISRGVENGEPRRQHIGVLPGEPELAVPLENYIDSPTT